MNQTLDISTATILRFVFIILGLVFLWLIRDVLLMFFLALILAAAVDGPVDWLAKHKVRRIFGTAIIYLCIIGVVLLFFYTVVPPLAGQINILANNLPGYITQFGDSLSLLKDKIGADYLQKGLEQISGQLNWAGSNIFGAAVNLFGGIFSAVVIFVISIYLVIQDKGIKDFLVSITPAENRPYVAGVAERIQSKLGAWLRGQLVLMFIIGLGVFIGLFFMKIKFALTLGILAGALEIVPYLGPILSAVPAVALAFMQSPFLAFLVVVLFIVVHELESNLIAPLVMKRALGLNPLVVIIALIIGGKLGGMIGVVVAVPLVAVASVFFGDMFLKNGDQDIY